MTRIDRRSFLTVGAVGGAALALLPATLPATAHAAPAVSTRQSTWQGRVSTNGWPILAADEAEQFRIEGSTLSVRLAPAAAPVLLHIARRFLYEIEHQVQPGEITGHTTDRRVRAPYESAYLSGSGIAIRPLLYPMGAKNGFFDDQKLVIRDILADCEGLVAWGGDLDPVTESHFHITAPPTSRRWHTLVAKLRGWDADPGKGAGT